MKRLVTASIILTLTLTGCASTENLFKDAISKCNVALGGIKPSSNSALYKSGYVEDSTPTEDSVSGVSGEPKTLFIDVTSVNDKVGLNIVASQCVLQGLGLNETTINTIWADQKNIDLAYKAAVAAYKKSVSDLKKAKSKVSSILRTNGNITTVAAQWKREYNSDPTCWSGYDPETDEDYSEPCSYSDWLEWNKDWYWGDPMKYTSSSSSAKNQVAKLEQKVKDGVVFAKGKLGTFQPVGQDGFSIAWFYSRKQGTVLAITKN